MRKALIDVELNSGQYPSLDRGQVFGIGTAAAVSQEKSLTPPERIASAIFIRGSHCRNCRPHVHKCFGLFRRLKYVSPKPIDLGCEVSNILNKVDPENAGDNIDTYCIKSFL